jgi:hypothetical protein
MFNRTYTAIDITNSDVRLASVKGKKLGKFLSNPLPKGLVGNGQIQNPQALGVIIDNMFKEAKLGKRRVLCTFTGLPFIYGAINMPRLSAAVENTAIERAARKELSLTEEDMYLSWQKIPTPSIEGELTYFVAGVPKNALGSIFQTLENAHIKPYNIDLKPLSLARVCASSEAIVVSLEQQYVDIVVVSNGLVKIMHSFVPQSPIEDKAGLVSEIIDGLNKALNSFKRDYPQSQLKPDTQVHLSGKFSGDKEVVKLLRSTSERKIVLLESPLALPEDCSMDIYSANIGLLLKKMRLKGLAGGFSDIDINLVSSVGLRRKPSNVLAYAAGTVVVAALAAVVFLTYTTQADAQNKLEAQQKAADSLAAQLVQARNDSKDLIASKTAAANALEPVNVQLVGLRMEHQQMLNANLDFTSQINYVNGYLPVGANLESISLDNQMVTVQGKALSAFDVLNFAVQLDKNPSFAGAKVSEIAPLQDGSVSFTITAVQPVQK